MTFPLSNIWRLVLGFAVVLGVVAVGASLPELLGLVPRGRLLGTASDAERIVAVVTGIVLITFGVTAWRSAKLVVTDDAVSFVRFGPLCSMRTIPFARITRFGFGHEDSRHGRRRTMILELDDRSIVRVMTEMYSRTDAIHGLLTERIGRRPSATKTGYTGLHFDDDEPVD